MQKRWMYIALSLIAFLVGACNSQADLPTLIPTSTVIVATEVEVQAVEPTETRVARPTLPPTWTPTVEPSETPLPTATEVVETFTPVPSPRAISQACDTFEVDADRSTRLFNIGESPTVYWTPVVGARLYHVFLLKFSGETVKNDIYVDVPEFTFDQSMFEIGETYLWSVWPLDPAGDQMCFERGADLIPQRVPSN